MRVRNNILATKKTFKTLKKLRVWVKVSSEAGADPVSAMNSAAAVALIKNLQLGFNIIAFLRLTTIMWPPQAEVKDGAQFDYIVLGAGTAGCVVAARLAEDKKNSVLLIEAGDEPALESIIPACLIYMGKGAADWNYKTENDRYTQQCHRSFVADLMLGKMLGGTSGSHFLLFWGGNSEDFDSWAKIADDDSWTWERIKSISDRTFSLKQTSNSTRSKGMLGLSKDTGEGLQDYLKAFEEVGNKIVSNVNPKNSTGYTTATYTISGGIRQSSANYLTPIKDYANLYVLKNTVAKKILFDKKNAVGVEVVTEDGRTMTFKALKEVVVSAGVVNSPKLLMLSGIGPEKHLKSKGIKVISNLPVGQNFQDHVGVVVIHNMTKAQDLDMSKDPREYPAHVLTGYVNLNKTKDFPEYSTVNYINIPKNLVQFCTVTYGLSAAICDRIFAHSNKNPMMFSIVTILKPKSQGMVLLRSSKYTDEPIVRPRYYAEKEDLTNQVKFIADFIRVTNTSTFQKAGGEIVDPKLLRCAKYKFGSADYWQCYALCMMTARRHYVGTNAIRSVVDSRLKVKGVNNLRVVDASVMPMPPSGEPLGPTIIIAEKAANMIKEDNE